MQRAHSLLLIKAMDADRRVITGVATTPTPDRVGDIVNPFGVKFTNPLPLLLYHDQDKPVGEVHFSAPTADGIPFTAQIARVAEPGVVKDRVDEAWHSVKAGLLKGVSIGHRPNFDKMKRIAKGGGILFDETHVFELSLVAVPQNAEATILSIKSFDLIEGQPAPGSDPLDEFRAAGPSATSTHQPAGPSAMRRVVVTTTFRQDTPMRITEQITAFENKRAAHAARITEITGKCAEGGRTKTQEEKTEFDTLMLEIKSMDDELVDLRATEELSKSMAIAAVGTTPADAAASRARVGAPASSIITVTPNVEPGIEFTRAVICKLKSFLSQGSISPMEYAKQMYPDFPRIQLYLKATVPAGTTTDATWAGNLVDPTNLASEFIAYLRPMTIIGKFGTNGIPPLNAVPFNIRVTGQTSGGNAWWVGQGAPKPVTSFGTSATTLLWAKIAAISVITEELARFSSPSAETMIRNGLTGAIVEQLDRDFVDPATAAVANVSPASITNGLTPLSSAGTSADNVRTDIGNLLEAFITNNLDPTQLVLIMPNTLALSLSLMVNALGQREFGDLTMRGGSLLGFPVIASQAAANQSGHGNLVIAVNANEIFLADDGQVSIEASREASIQMLDNPTNNSATGTATQLVSMWQTNSIALKAERFINWARRRNEAVSYMDDVNWGAIGSPS